MVLSSLSQWPELPDQGGKPITCSLLGSRTFTLTYGLGDLFD